MAFNWDQYRQFSQVLTIIDSKFYSFHKDQHWVRIRPSDFTRWISFLHKELNFLHLIDLHFMKNDNYTELYYHFQNIEQHQRLNLIVEIYPGDQISSVMDIFPAAEWMEKELVEKLGFTLFGRTPCPFLGIGNEGDKTLPRVPFNPNRNEAPYPEEKCHWEYFDITRPELNFLFAAKVNFEGDTIRNIIPTIGLHRQNWDHILEECLPHQQIGLIDQINLLSAPAYSILMSKLYEDISNTKIPERAQAIRMIFLELSRIVEHLSALYHSCYDLKLATESNLLLSCREKVFEIYEKYSGRRSGSNISRLGGVPEDLPHGWNVELIEFEKILRKVLVATRNQLRTTPVIQDQKFIGKLAPYQAIRYGTTGPVLRASGINFDLRKSRPFYFYADIDFDIPVGIYGGNMDRLLLRFEEVFESLRIIIQVIDNLPLGSFVLNEEEVMHLLATPQVNSFFTSFEAGQGELGVYYLKDSEKARFKLRTPSLTNAQSLPILLNDVPRKYLKSTLSLLGLNSREIDR